MAENGWDKFWGSRQVPLKKGQLEKFYNNYKVIAEMVKKHWEGESLFQDVKSLEVGCGRGTLSEYFQGYGWKTRLCDIGDHRLNKEDNFDIVNVFDLVKFYGREKFDVIFSYGLLEHFQLPGQIEMLDQIGQVTKTGGVSIHYVVPAKIMNLNEDKTVYRDRCESLIDIIGEENIAWVFPAFNLGPWLTNKWLGKGFFFGVSK
jgi:2-polyprenyl-3-methyl-5-hydroxy-6-metoxy-1,4-benzoquinol methylase